MTPNTDSTHLDTFGARIVKRLSRRRSNPSGSKGSATTDTAGDGGIGQQALDKGEGIKDQIGQGNLSGVQNIVMGENTQTTTSQSDTAGAMGDMGSSKEGVVQNKPENIRSRLFGRRSSASRYQYNDDIKKGPIIKGLGYAASGSGNASAGTGTAMGRSGPTTGESGVEQRDVGQARVIGEGSSSQGLTQPMIAKQNDSGISSTGDVMAQELEEQSHIDSDVFTSAPSNEDAARGLSGSKDATIATHAPKSSTSKSSQAWPIAGGLGLGAVGAGLMGAERGYKQDVNQRDFGQETSTGITTANTTMDMLSGVHSSPVVKNFSGSSYKVTVLQERVHAVVQKCKNQLGVTASEISKRCPTVDAFFDVVAAERLRWMPRDGSRLDCCLRWASRLAYAVDAMRKSIGAFAPGANEAAKLIWGFKVLLLEVGSRNMNGDRGYANIFR